MHISLELFLLAAFQKKHVEKISSHPYLLPVVWMRDRDDFSFLTHFFNVAEWLGIRINFQFCGFEGSLPHPFNLEQDKSKESRREETFVMSEMTGKFSTLPKVWVKRLTTTIFSFFFFLIRPLIIISLILLLTPLVCISQQYSIHEFYKWPFSSFKILLLQEKS